MTEKLERFGGACSLEYCSALLKCILPDLGNYPLHNRKNCNVITALKLMRLERRRTAHSPQDLYNVFSDLSARGAAQSVGFQRACACEESLVAVDAGLHFLSQLQVVIVEHIHIHSNSAS
jgi:hypothetical protein